MIRLQNVVGGSLVDGKRLIQVNNPATGREFAECPDTTREEFEQAVLAARESLRGWRSDEDARRCALRACGQIVDDNAQVLATLLTQEQGKPIREALAEVKLAAQWFATVAALPLQSDVLENTDERHLEVRREPYGVVGAITPWNYPIILAVCKVAPALLAGNAVVLKPSPFTPVSTLKLGALLARVLPPGTLNVLSGGDDLGRWVAAHPLIKKVSFTGSIETGKAIMRSAAADLKRLTLELGGNDAAIVLPDVDVDQVASDIFWSAFTNAGQFCVAIKRLYVHETVCAAMVKRLVDIASNCRVGNGLDPETHIGPLTTRAQLDRVAQLVSEARASGGRVETGGRQLDAPGNFYSPTIMTNVTEGARLVDEEQFGPVLPVLSFGDVDSAIERANATPYGLGGSVWTNDATLGAKLAARLECGMCWVNQHAVFHILAPFGGFKWSGIGCENGTWGLSEFAQLKVIYRARRTPATK